MIFVVVGREEGAVASVIVVAMVVLVSTARVLWHPCTMNSGKQNFLSLSKALFSGHVLFSAGLLPVHSK
jgi:multisubunit Na+/H+ antiporter MnhB subunit